MTSAATAARSFQADSANVRVRLRDAAISASVGVGVVMGQAGQYHGFAGLLLRPLIAAAIVGGAIYVVIALSRLSRDRTLLASVIVVGLLGGLVVPVVAATLLLPVWWYWRHIRGHRPELDDAFLASSVRKMSIAFAAVGFVTFGLSGPSFSYASSSTSIQHSTRPPIFLILLDGYPRQDSLAQYFGVDNEPFLAALEARGYDVYEEAASNYTMTALTLATMFQASDADALGIDAASKDGQFRALHRHLNEGRVWDALRQEGYRIASVPATLEGVRLMTADVAAETGLLSGFEWHMLDSTSLGWLLDSLGWDFDLSQHRARLEAGFRAIPALGADGTVTYAHLLLPHRPLVYQADGTARKARACQNDCSDAEFYPAYAAQLAYTNDRLLELVDELPEHAVVALFSDHGSREPADEREWLRTLLVAKTPGHPDLFDARPTPLQWFPRLLNTYAGTRLPEHDAGHWASGPRRPLDLHAVQP